MRNQIRLRVLLPIAAVALLGLGVGAMAFTGTPTEEPAPAPLPKASPGQTTTGQEEPSTKEQAMAARAADRLVRRDWRKTANAVCAELNESVSALGEPQSPEDSSRSSPRPSPSPRWRSLGFRRFSRRKPTRRGSTPCLTSSSPSYGSSAQPPRR